MTNIFPNQQTIMTIEMPIGDGYFAPVHMGPTELVGMASNSVAEGLDRWDAMISSGNTDFENMGFELAGYARHAKEWLNGAYAQVPEYVRSVANVVEPILTDIARLETASDIYYDGALVQWENRKALAQLEAYWGSSEPVWDYIFSLQQTVADIPEKIGESVGKGLKAAGVDPSLLPYAYGAGTAVGILALGIGAYIFLKR